MARNFRYYEKKRGDRRTGSRAAASVGEALFFASLLLLGCAGLVAIVLFLLIPQWQVQQEYVQGTCTVLHKRSEPTQDDDGTTHQPGIHVEYQVGKETYRTWIHDVQPVYDNGGDDQQAALDRFVPGSRYPCWYDPADPHKVVLSREGNAWIWLVMIVPLSFIALGGGGFLYRALHWGKSAERRKVLAQRVQQTDLFGANGDSNRKLPNVPDDADITNSPGTRLKFRLPIGTSPGWALFGIMIACLFWNGIVGVFVAMAVGDYLAGEPDWLLTLFLVPFLLVGFVLVYVFIRQLLVTTGIGPTLVEISDHPLHAGDCCRLFISQSGRLAFHSLEVLLVCEEEATYRQGTDTRTETREVHRQQILRREGFDVQRGLPFETECELTVPAQAMHSFKSDHNEINWKVVVEGEVAGWPDYKRSFLVIVHPPNGRAPR
ncbi:MAG: DUF3592 domain-containing protein [Pirellulales bacterium]|nr:DUF3592 domain-containing protein [Pirellulales bacterium]